MAGGTVVLVVGSAVFCGFGVEAMKSLITDKRLTAGLLYRSGDTTSTELASGPGAAYYELALEYTRGLAGVQDKPAGHQLAEHVEIKAGERER